MLTNIQVKNFRCFRELEIAALRRVNLITGQNNTGKTALLEALRILLAQPNPTNADSLPSEFRAGVGNADVVDNFWDWLCHDKNFSLPVEIGAALTGNTFFGIVLWRFGSDFDRRMIQKEGLHTLGFLGQWQAEAFGSRQPNAGLKAVHFAPRPTDPTRDAIDFNRVVIKRRKKDLAGLLRPLEPRLETLEAVHTNNNFQAPLICADLGLREMIPVVHLGQGFCRLLSIFTEILVSDAKVLLVDEIENGIHYGVMSTVWQGLFHAAKEANLQIFATTHSWECILAADKAARESDNYDLSLIRLDRVGGDVKATVMDEKTLATAKELNWELR